MGAHLGGRLVSESRKFANEFLRGGLRSLELEEEMRTLEKMQSLARFFELYQSDPPQIVEAFRLLTQDLNLVPIRQEDLQTKVQEFNILEDCVKRNFSDILLAAMRLLFAMYQDRNYSSEQRLIKIAARILNTYSGMIPFQMPGNDNQEFTRLNMQIF